MRAIYNDGSTSEYFVEDEKTLVYEMSADKFFYGILASSVRRGGRLSLQGCFPKGVVGTLRPATLADFEFFRVVPPKSSSICTVEL
jgi:hypothetical protein